MLPRIILIRAIYSIVILLSIVAVTGILIILKSKIEIYQQVTDHSVETPEYEPFPVSVDIAKKIIIEDPSVNNLFEETFANAPESKNKWWNQLAAVLFSKDWYQNLASPVSRIIVIWPGERKEQLSKNIGDVLAWSQEDKETFMKLVDEAEPKLAEGKYFPGQYVTHKKATPEDIYKLVYGQFENEILDRYTPEVEAMVPLDQALIIASLLEREAGDFHNMREISGVIWNRIFIDMPLQLDASLQYIKGSNPYEPNWWPIVKPKDKFQDSPFNTYQNSGLPPAPISNVSTESVLAALNPIKTTCLYYFHTENGQYYCSENYQGHVDKLKEIYGRGK